MNEGNAISVTSIRTFLHKIVVMCPLRNQVIYRSILLERKPSAHASYPRQISCSRFINLVSKKSPLSQCQFPFSPIKCIYSVWMQKTSDSVATVIWILWLPLVWGQCRRIFVECSKYGIHSMHCLHNAFRVIKYN